MRRFFFNGLPFSVAPIMPGQDDLKPAENSSNSYYLSLLLFGPLAVALIAVGWSWLFCLVDGREFRPYFLRYGVWTGLTLGVLATVAVAVLTRPVVRSIPVQDRHTVLDRIQQGLAPLRYRVDQDEPEFTSFCLPLGPVRIPHLIVTVWPGAGSVSVEGPWWLVQKLRKHLGAV